MGVTILQHKGNKSDSSAIGKKSWAYRIGTPQGFFCLMSASGPYCGARHSKTPCGIFLEMDVGIPQHNGNINKGNQLKSSVIGKNP
jgi:hypothetical protein